MCGIAGIAGVGKHDALTRIRCMEKALQHRGPDAGGFYETENIALAHRRLSIIDLSEKGNQPFVSADGRFVLIFNGEIYNFREIKKELAEYPFVSASDAEVVLAAYIKWGPASLSKLKGMFAFAIWDNAEEKLFIARDRFGVKPVYYYHVGETFLFASEIRSILASGIVPKKINRQALSDYLKYQSVIAPLTLVQGIMQLPAGHYLEFKRGNLLISKYWDITDAKIATDDVSKEQVYKQIRELLFKAVERRLVSDVPIGAFLSGGIDSSAIVAIMSEISEKKPVAFTVAFEEKDYDESAFATIVAKKYGVQHTKIMLKPNDFLDQLPSALRAMDSPSGDGPNTYVISKAIKESGITVALSGVGGDELFAGYPLFHQFKRIRQYDKLYGQTYWLRKLLNSMIPGGNQKRARMKSIFGSHDADISHIYPILRQIQTNDRLMELTSLKNGELMPGTLERQLQKNQFRFNSFDSFSQVSIAEYFGYTQHVLLKDTDQMSMAVALEVREPFFDHELVEYLLSVPDSYKCSEYPKQLLVESLGDMLPSEIVHRKKQGFTFPWNSWLRNELRDFCQTHIDNLCQRDFIRDGKPELLWKQFLSGDKTIRWMEIWLWVVLEHWLEKNDID
jgi:asparagine synthase (glutamine-hydrolysing)